MQYDIFQGDVVKWAEQYEGEPFHAMYSDVPYELRELDAEEVELILAEQARPIGKGFMGRRWDGSGTVFNPATWRALARHLYPGAYIFIMGGTLNDDLITLAMRRAGLRKHHKAMAWANGSSFPKATRIDTQIDKAAGAVREVVGVKANMRDIRRNVEQDREQGWDNGQPKWVGSPNNRLDIPITAPATDLARTWAGHRYGLQSLKPALEPVIVFQKPYAGRPVDCITTTGAGALNIDGSRIGTELVEQGRAGRMTDGGYGRGYGSDEAAPATGRWPSNLLLIHTPACTAARCDPSCPVEALGAQSGETTSDDRAAYVGKLYNDDSPVPYKKGTQGAGYNDTGTAARFFHQSTYMLDRLDAADPVQYVAKASTAEREAGLEALEELEHAAYANGKGIGGRSMIDGEWVNTDNPRLPRRNTHPTVKPIDLCKYLATLLLPPPEYGPRRLLIPFSGSGSEMVGAGLAGWEYCQGVELEKPHVDIALARLEWWIDVFGAERREAA